MEMLTVGVDRTVIGLWLGHERFETTQMLVEATPELKDEALTKIRQRKVSTAVKIPHFVKVKGLSD